MSWTTPIYPTNIPSVTEILDGTDDVTWLNLEFFKPIRGELYACLNQLGSLPAGSKSNVTERLAVSLNNDGTLKSSLTPIFAGLTVNGVTTLNGATFSQDIRIASGKNLYLNSVGNDAGLVGDSTGFSMKGSGGYICGYVRDSYFYLVKQSIVQVDNDGAYIVRNSSANNVFTVDTNNGRVFINQNAGSYGYAFEVTASGTSTKSRFNTLVEVKNTMQIGANYASGAGIKFFEGSFSLQYLQDQGNGPLVLDSLTGFIQYATGGSYVGYFVYPHEFAGDVFILDNLYVGDGNVGIGTTSVYSKLEVAGAIGITDGITTPGTHSGHAYIYVDSADGDLKIKFGDGTVKTIVTDT